MPDMYNPDFNSPEIHNAIDVIAAQKTAEVIGYFQKAAQVAHLETLPQDSREKCADDTLTKIANGPLPGAMLASVMMSFVENNKTAAKQEAAEISALRTKIAEKHEGKKEHEGKEKHEGKGAKAVVEHSKKHPGNSVGSAESGV